MLNFIKQDLTDIERGIVAHGCNCQGVMGSGVALSVRRKWPVAFTTYTKLCESYDRSKDLLGHVHFVVVESDDVNNPEIVVANMFTQHRYGSDGKVYASIEAVATGLDEVCRTSQILHLDVYMPRIGCGLGGLSWPLDVGPIVEQLTEKYPDVNIFVCDL